MKKLLTITALLFSLTSFGQNLKILENKWDLLYQVDIKGVLTISANNDTLEIKSKDIKFIKVDGKVYEIKRTTELKEVKKEIFPRGIGWGIPTNLIDTTFLPKNQQKKQTNILN